MRMIVKGGVWKNTEDEILKAAVMKYGKNQWARIASLLHRKTAKQCKARWYEWLDPSIKKTEWTREEEEKLLHLAKLFPTQWRTIAPMIGRTGGQCLAHYEYLLDQAQQKDGVDEGDPRKLKPGEIDPNAESKPARPDPVDMDEDEKEMLSEARARLANTVGKKAKRKAREKQLEEARRLSMLQKRRELRAAGIDIKKRFKKNKHRIDYNAEIPFEKKVPLGFYDVDDEHVMENSTEFKAKTLEQLEGRRRDKDEADLRKKDKEKATDRKGKAMADAIKQLNNATEPPRKRSKLVLPNPQVSDVELEKIVKVGAQSMTMEDDNGVTGELLSDYSATLADSLPTRTPRIPMAEDTILQEAQNLIALTNAQTPLLGGDNVTLNQSSFKGVTPQRQIMQTPNTVLKTPAHAGLPDASGRTPSVPMTPRLGDGRLAATPARDTLGINVFEASETPGVVSKNEMMNNKTGLLAGLRSLPRPKNDFEVVVPENEDLPEEVEVEREEDAEERDARRKEKEAEDLAIEMERRSTAIKRDLPRPLRINPQTGVAELSGVVTDLQIADALVRQEMVALMKRDAQMYPLGNHVPKGDQSIPFIDDDDIQNAREVLADETKNVLSEEMGDMSIEAFEAQCFKAWEKSTKQLTYLPSQNKFGRLSLAQPAERLNAVKLEFKNVMDRLKKEGYKKAAKLEKKAILHTAGFQKRSDTLREEIKTTSEQFVQATTDLKCFTALRATEQASIKGRVEALENETQHQERLLANYQSRFAELQSEKESLVAALS
eukprot:CFRG7395T1